MNFFMLKWVSNSEILKSILRLEKIMSSNQEKIDALSVQLNKAKTEIVAQIEALKNQPGAEVLDFSALDAAAQGLDDLNPDPVDPVPFE